jgi:hypothetical protein
MHPAAILDYVPGDLIVAIVEWRRECIHNNVGCLIFVAQVGSGVNMVVVVITVKPQNL